MEKAAKFIGFRRHCLTTDGEGVTTLAAFWGCPLRCQYCLNPHSLREGTKCEMLTPEQLYDKVKLDNLYFLATNGGVTFGGGEPLLQVPFMREFREICGRAWRLYIETSLNVPWSLVQATTDIIDGYIVDIKDTDPEIYRAYTTRENEQVLDNLRRLIEIVGTENVLVRVPLIPNFNTEEHRARSKKRLRELGVTRFDELTYRTQIKK
jgi:pyruvate formate lyase activating enzyme